MNQEQIQQMQDRVEAWVSQSQHKVKYFPPFEIVAQLSEELAELETATSDVTKSKSEIKTEIKKEVGDVLFVLCCLSNSKDLQPAVVPDVKYGLNINEHITRFLYRLGGDIAREVSHIDGFKKKKEGEVTDGLPKAIGRMLYMLQILCDVNQFDVEECFDLTMAKKEARDKFRFAK